MWFCPTFQRPERLAALAVSWNKCAKKKPLAVRVWKDDPRLKDYFSISWPKGWDLYVSEAEYCIEAVNEFFEQHPGQGSYGFIGDDVVLRTPWGLDKLERLAEGKFLAYPNDLIQRNRLCTHFCMGGDLARVLGWVMPPQFKHGYTDLALFNIGINSGILRYAPEVIFDHQHIHVGKAEMDDTYERAEMHTEPGRIAWEEYAKDELGKDVVKVLHFLHAGVEDPESWGYKDEFVRRNIA